MTDKQREVRNRWLRMADRADHQASFAERKGEQADATEMARQREHVWR